LADELGKRRVTNSNMCSGLGRKAVKNMTANQRVARSLPDLLVSIIY